MPVTDGGSRPLTDETARGDRPTPDGTGSGGWNLQYHLSGLLLVFVGVVVLAWRAGDARVGVAALVAGIVVLVGASVRRRRYPLVAGGLGAAGFAAAGVALLEGRYLSALGFAAVGALAVAGGVRLRSAATRDRDGASDDETSSD